MLPGHDASLSQEIASFGCLIDAPDFDLIQLWRFQGAIFLDTTRFAGAVKTDSTPKNRTPAGVIELAREMDGIVDWQGSLAHLVEDTRLAACRESAAALAARDGVTCTLQMRQQTTHVWELGRNNSASSSLSHRQKYILAGVLHHSSILYERQFADARAPTLLTGREVEVLNLCKHGHSYAQTAAKLGISPKTVEYHVGNVMRKLGTKDKLAAILQAVRLGLIEL